jgi:hypothetical protein
MARARLAEEGEGVHDMDTIITKSEEIGTIV